MILTNEMNENFANQFSESVGTLHGLQKSAIAYLFSDPRLQLVKLNDREYAECQMVYRSYDNEKEAILEATLETIEKKMPSQERYNILSIGCGMGIFEEPFVKKFLERKRSLHFVGVDINQEACQKTREWCQKLSRYYPDKFQFTINSIGFEKFTSPQNFDIILLIHTLYYFDEIEPSIRKSYELLKEGGMAIVGIAPRQLLNEPYYHVCRRLNGKPAWFSEDVQKVITECNLPFRQETIEFSANITECFQKESQLGKRILDFMIGANTAYFSPSQLRQILDYFDSVSQKMEGGEIMLPHSATLFYLDKMS